MGPRRRVRVPAPGEKRGARADRDDGVRANVVESRGLHSLGGGASSIGFVRAEFGFDCIEPFCVRLDEPSSEVLQEPGVSPPGFW